MEDLIGFVFCILMIVMAASILVALSFSLLGFIFQPDQPLWLIAMMAAVIAARNLKEF